VRLRAFNDSVNPESVLVGEAYVPKWEELMRYYGPSNNGVHLPFNFFLVMEPARSKLDAKIFRDTIEQSERALAAIARNATASNHDIPRHYDRLGDGQHNDLIAKLTATMLLTLRGSPFLYYGEEIGMVNHDPERLEDVRDPVGKTYWPREKGRDGERTPMQWNGNANAGFSAESATPWLKVGADYKTVNAVDEGKSRTSMLSFYRRLLALRKASPALLDGDYQPVGDSDKVFAYKRGNYRQTMIVALNMSAEPQTVRVDDRLVPQGRGLQIVLSNIGIGQQVVADKTIPLKPYEAVIVEVTER